VIKAARQCGYDDVRIEKAVQVPDIVQPYSIYELYGRHLLDAKDETLYAYLLREMSVLNAIGQTKKGIAQVEEKTALVAQALSVYM
jgi:hypothetical protein